MQEIESGNFAVPRWIFCPPDSIRVVNWNIDRGFKLRGVIEFLDGAKADIILLQEADLNARRTHHINVAREIAQKLQMNYVFGREFQELTQGKDIVHLQLLRDFSRNVDMVCPPRVAREIAQKLQMNYVFGREFQELTQGSKT